MSWRTVIITSRCKLDYKMGFMVVRAEETKKIFLDEIAVLLIENPAVSLTGCLLEALVEKKIRVIFCDARRTPNAELDRDRLFVMINMRTYFSDEEMEIFIESVCLHSFKILLIESSAQSKLKNTQRYTVDEDLC